MKRKITFALLAIMLMTSASSVLAYETESNFCNPDPPRYCWG